MSFFKRVDIQNELAILGIGREADPVRTKRSGASLRSLEPRMTNPVSRFSIAKANRPVSGTAGVELLATYRVLPASRPGKLIVAPYPGS